MTPRRARSLGRILAATIGILLLVVAALGAMSMDIAGAHGEAVEALAELSAAEARLNDEVLRVVSLRRQHYDSIVETVREVEAHRQHLLALLDAPAYGDKPAIARAATRYSEELAEKIDIVEQVKGGAAFLRNEVAYIPFAVSEFALYGDPAAAVRLLDLSQALMALRSRLSAERRSQIEAAIARVSSLTAIPEAVSLLPHFRAYLGEMDHLDLVLGRYLAIDTQGMLAELRARLLEQQAADERSTTLITRMLGVFSALLVGGLGAGAVLLVRTRAGAAVERRRIERLKAERDQRRRMAEALAEKVGQLERTRGQLVHSEKMASLGRMVAGFAHEVNMPIGLAVAAASPIPEALAHIHDMVRGEAVDEEALNSRLRTIDEAVGLMLTNLRRAAQLMRSFTRTSADQSSDCRRRYPVAETVNDVLQSLDHLFKRTLIDIAVDCPRDLAAYGSAGALGQVLANLLMNSYLHGFDEGRSAGSIQIVARAEPPGQLHLEYSDNGRGMSAEVAERIFEPFFTTRRPQGGSGLGLYIVYYLVTASLGGSITCRSAAGQGCSFTIQFPERLEGPAQQRQEPEGMPT